LSGKNEVVVRKMREQKVVGRLDTLMASVSSVRSEFKQRKKLKMLGTGNP